MSLFLARFTLSEDDTEAMVSRDVPVDKRFFAAMDKAEQIRADCRVLMVGEEGSTKAGCVARPLHYSCSFLSLLRPPSMDIMLTTSSLLEQAYEKMFRYCCFEFRQMGGRDAQLDVEPPMREATRRLRQRPELLAYASRLSFLIQD